MRRVAPWLLAGLLLLILADLLVEREPPSVLSDEASPNTPQVAPPPKAAAKARRAAIPAPRSPRATPQGPTLTVVDAEPAAVEAEAEAEPGGGVDPALPLTPESLKTVADRMRPSIAACIEAWTVEFPTLRGEVVLGFQLNAQGVQAAWVVEQDSVPPAVLGCFSAAVYEQDWPAAPEGVEVTFPFTLEAGLVDDPDAGPPVDRRGESDEAG